MQFIPDYKRRIAALDRDNSVHDDATGSFVRTYSQEGLRHYFYYEPADLLGRGTYGKVYRGYEYNADTGEYDETKPIAVKRLALPVKPHKTVEVLHKELSALEFSEFSILSRFYTVFHVPRTWDGHSSRDAVIIMPFFDGFTLSKDIISALPYASRIKLILDLANTLTQIHSVRVDPEVRAAQARRKAKIAQLNNILSFADTDDTLLFNAVVHQRATQIGLQVLFQEGVLPQIPKGPSSTLLLPVRHHDIKESNVILKRSPGHPIFNTLPPFSAELIDWGLACEVDDEAAPHPDQGTHMDYPPESLHGVTCSDGHDIFAFGALVLSFLGARNPYEFKDVYWNNVVSLLKTPYSDQNLFAGFIIPESVFIDRYFNSGSNQIHGLLRDFIKQITAPDPERRLSALYIVKFFQLLVNLHIAYKNIALSESHEDRIYCRQRVLELFARAYVMNLGLDPLYADQVINAREGQRAILGLTNDEELQRALAILQEQLDNPAWGLTWINQLESGEKIGAALLALRAEEGPEDPVDLAGLGINTPDVHADEMDVVTESVSLDMTLTGSDLETSDSCSGSLVGDDSSVSSDTGVRLHTFFESSQTASGSFPHHSDERCLSRI